MTLHKALKNRFCFDWRVLLIILGALAFMLLLATALSPRAWAETPTKYLAGEEIAADSHKILMFDLSGDDIQDATAFSVQLVNPTCSDGTCTTGTGVSLWWTVSNVYPDDLNKRDNGTAVSSYQVTGDWPWTPIVLNEDVETGATKEPHAFRPKPGRLLMVKVEADKNEDLTFTNGIYIDAHRGAWWLWPDALPMDQHIFEFGTSGSTVFSEEKPWPSGAVAAELIPMGDSIHLSFKLGETPDTDYAEVEETKWMGSLDREQYNRMIYSPGGTSAGRVQGIFYSQPVVKY